MLSCFVWSVEKIHTQNFKSCKDENGIIMLLSHCVVFDSKYSKFIKQQETSRLSSSLAIKLILSKIPLVDPLLF